MLTRHFAGIARPAEECRPFVKQWFRQIIGRLVNILGSGLRLNAYYLSLRQCKHCLGIRIPEKGLDVIVVRLSVENEQAPNLIMFYYFFVPCKGI